MIKEIRIYIEGLGEDNKKKLEIKNPNFKSKLNQGKEKEAGLRRGFQSFFKEIKDLAQSKNINLEIIMCGGRKLAYNDFSKALESHPEAFNILLVDSEGKISQDQSPWQYLETNKQDKWQSLNLSDDHCHLMVQTMEAWFIADLETLRQFYGDNFVDTKIINGLENDKDNIENVTKYNLQKWIEHATKHCKNIDGSSKKYNKSQHPPKLLAIINVEKVRKKCYWCNRIFRTLIKLIEQLSYDKEKI